MTVRHAWRLGFSALGRYPWLALIPLLADLAQLGLGYLRVPLAPTDGSALARVAPDVAFTAFLPSFLPSAGNLGLSLQPGGLTVAPGWPLMLVVLLGALWLAVLYGLFLGLLSAAVQQKPLTVRGAVAHTWRATPGLFIFFLVGRLAVTYLDVDAELFGGIAWGLLFALLPLGLGARGLPLFEALPEAPGILWGRLGAWLGLGLRTGLATGSFVFFWSLAGRPAWLALAVYPFVATGLVAAAVALYLSPSEAEAEPHMAVEAAAPSPWRWVLAIGLAAPLAFSGYLLLQTWQGWAPTRAAALAPRYGDDVYIRYTRPAPSGEWIQFTTRGRPGIALLEPGRFGWKAVIHEAWPGGERDVLEPILARITNTSPLGLNDPNSPQVLWGELLDSRVAFLDVAGQRYPVGEAGPFFAIELPPDVHLFAQPGPEVQVLDAAGMPVPRRERGQ